MAYYFRNPLDATTAFQSIRDKIAKAAVYEGNLEYRDNFKQSERKITDLTAESRADTLELIDVLENSGLTWLVYDRQLVAPDYLATMLDAGLGYSRAAGLQIVAYQLTIYEHEHDPKFIALFLAGCKSEADAKAFRDNCENRDLVV